MFWLTDEELERIITYVPKNANNNWIRTQFLIRSLYWLPS